MEGVKGEVAVGGGAKLEMRRGSLAGSGETRDNQLQTVYGVLVN